MPYCPQCGVEMDDSLPACPLCNYPVPIIKNKKENKDIADDTGDSGNYKPTLTSKEKIKIIWQIVSIFLISSIVIIFTINYIIDKTISWSSYPLTFVIYAYILISLSLLLYKNWLTIWIASFLITGVNLFLIDIIDGKLTWYLPLALPLTAIGFVHVFVCALIYIKVKNRGVHIGAFIIILSSIVCIALDIIIKLYAGNTIIPTWSLIVFVANIPISVFLLFFHYSFKNKINIKKFFHF
ncbi:DUF6320 domain-containing protein [Spirochaetota bacterium]